MRKSKLPIILLGLLLVFGVGTVLWTNNSSKIQAAWWNDSWNFRNAVPVSTHTAAENNVYVSVTIDSTSNFQADCGDMRWTDQGGNLLPYYIVSGCGGASMVTHIFLQSFPAGAQTLFYYYGNELSANGFSSGDFVTEATSYTIGTIGSQEKSAGPVAYWAFDEGTGTTANDLTSNGFKGTLTGGPVWQPENMCISGMCLKLNGTTDYVTYGAPSTSSVVNITGPMTISVWVKPATNQNSDAQIISRYGAYGLAMPSNSSLKFYFWGSDLSINYTFVPGQWYHLVGVYDGTDRKFFVNGKLMGKFASSDPPSASGNLSVGYLYDLGGTKYFKGFIDEPKIYNYARSDEEIKLEFNSRGGGGKDGIGAVMGDSSTVALTDGLVSYYRMEESSGNLYDDSGNLIELTNNNITTYVTGKFGNGTEYVPASNQYFSTSTTVSGVKSVSFWTNPDSTTNYFFSLTSGAYVTASSGVLSATGFTSPKIYVNGVASTTITADSWQLVTVTSETAIDASQFYIGRQGGNYYDGTLDEMRIYNRVLAPAEIQQIYNFAPGPVGYWNFEDAAQGSAVADRSGYGNNGSWSGSGSRWALGKYGAGGTFNGSDDYVSNGNTTSEQLTRGTIEAWIKTSNAGSTHRGILVKQLAYGLFLYNNEFEIYDWGTASRRGTGVNVADGNWHHLVATFESGVTNGTILYIDGVSRLTTTMTVSAQTQNLLIGHGNDAGQYFSGLIDQAQIYNYIRTPKQIVSDMNAGHPAGGSPVGSQVGYWKFDEGQGTVAYDSSQFRTNGTINGLSSPATETSGWSKKGRFNGALVFDGTNDYVSVSGTASQLRFTSAFTISTWVNMESSTNLTDLITKAGNFGNFGWWLYTETDGTVHFEVSSDGSGSIVGVASQTSLQAKTWYHIVATYEPSSSMKIFVNGKLDKSTQSSVPASVFNSTANIEFGSQNGGTGSDYSGLIDEVKFYNYALNQQDVNIEYNRGQSVKSGVLGVSSVDGKTASDSAATAYCVPGDTSSCNPPILEWRFEQNQGSSALDTSGNELTGGLQNSPEWVVGAVGNGLNFNLGSSQYVSNSSSILNFTSGSFTLSAWFKVPTGAQINDSYRVLSKWQDYTHIPYEIFVSGDYAGDVACLIYDGDYQTAIDNRKNYADGKWHHVECVVTTSQILLYVDGTLGGVDTHDNSFPSASANFQVGAGTAIPNYFSGSIDEVRVFNYARTPAQVAYDYNRGAPVSHWKMDECQGTVVNDSSRNGNLGTLTIGGSGGQAGIGTCVTNAATAWYNGRSGKYSSSLNFDGTDDYVSSGGVFLSLGTTDVPYSFSGWVNPAVGETDGEIIHLSSLSDGGGWCLPPVKLVGSKIASNSWSGSLVTATGLTTLQSGTWYHFAVTWDSTNGLRVFVNGKLEAKTAQSTYVASGVSNYVAIARSLGSCSGNAGFFEGKVDDVKVFNYSLTQNQVQMQFNQGSAARF